MSRGHRSLNEGRNNMFSNDVLTSIAEKHNKSVAQVVLLACSA